MLQSRGAENCRGLLQLGANISGAIIIEGDIVVDIDVAPGCHRRLAVHRPSPSAEQCQRIYTQKRTLVGMAVTSKTYDDGCYRCTTYPPLQEIFFVRLCPSQADFSLHTFLC